MRPKFVASAFLVAVLAAPASAQVCGPLFPSGQPGLLMTPLCLALLPPPIVWVAGNPGFALSSFAPPPIPVGLPTTLVFGVPIPPPFPIPAPPLHPAFGVPGLLASPPALILGFFPAGPSGPAPGPPVILPIPPTGGPLGLVASFHTLVFIPAALMPPGGFALTAAVGVTI